MPVPNLKNRKCLVTGAASGIGKAVAIAVAQDGAELVLTDINAVQLLAVVDEIRAQGGKVACFRAFDISSHDAVRGFADDVQRDVGSMDVLMNIAGIAIWGAVENLQHQHWQRCIDINLMGPINVIECFVPAMIKAGRGGHLVNVSSAAGLFGLPLHAAYSASKFGLRGVSEVLRFDLARHGIGVSLVCPGGVRTGLVGTVQVAGVDMEQPEMKKLKNHFVSHAVTPEHAAKKILEGVRKNRYMVFTSLDIRVGYWFQRKFAWPYEIAMQLLNNYLQKAMSKARGQEK